MNITLISPYPDVQAFGIRTLSACLKEEGHDVQLVFLPSAHIDKYEDEVMDEVVELAKDSQLVGITLMTNFFDNSVQITRKLKAHYDFPIVWGGIHPTIRPEECINYADIVCIGEGEDSLVELADMIDKGQDYHHIKGLWFNDNENIVKNQNRSLTKSLDDIPYPDYDYKTHFILTNGHVQKMDAGLLKQALGSTYVTIPTRGCPYVCTYCCNNAVTQIFPENTSLRAKTIDYLINELLEVTEKLPFIERIKFDDDAFFVYSVKNMQEFSEQYRNKIGLPLRVTGATPVTLTREKLTILVDGGLDSIRMGIESANTTTKKLYKRRYTNKQVEKSVRLLHEFRNKTEMPKFDFILDNPWETDDDLVESLNFLSSLPTPFTLNFFSLLFYPGTELYDIAKADGMIKDDWNDVYRQHYKRCTLTYLNRVFFLLNEYASNNIAIKPIFMFCLTNQMMRKLKLNWLVYGILLIAPFKSNRLRGIRKLRSSLKHKFARKADSLQPAFLAN